MRTINDWLALAQRGIKIVGLEYYTPDRIRVLAQFPQLGAGTAFACFLLELWVQLLAGNCESGRSVYLAKY
jgi:hypothetical protein